MPKPNSKHFIDKKNAVTFKLGHRSQQDPLVADESAPQRVLIPIIKNSENKTASAAKPKEESKKYSVVFDEDYNYLEKLPDTRTLDNDWERTTRKEDDASTLPEEGNQKITLPSSLFESNVEEKVGLLNKAAPNPRINLKLDADIVAALDDDFAFDDPDNELEDNFIELANGPINGNSNNEFEGELDDDDLFMDDSDEEIYYGNKFDMDTAPCPFSKEETKSRFTEYSITSSVMKRNDQLSMLDDKFEKLYADYDEQEVGPLDCEEIEGIIGVDSERLLKISEKYNEELEVENITELMNNGMSLKRKASLDDDCDIEYRKSVTLLSDKNKWDCESILSVYNNTENHPKTIKECKNPNTIRIHAKTGIPISSTPQLTSAALKIHAPVEVNPTFAKSKSLPRPKNETPEERKQRKQTIKNERRERRVERKINILAFKEEEKKQKQILLNKNQNIQGNRIL